LFQWLTATIVSTMGKDSITFPSTITCKDLRITFYVIFNKSNTKMELRFLQFLNSKPSILVTFKTWNNYLFLPLNVSSLECNQKGGEGETTFSMGMWTPTRWGVCSHHAHLSPWNIFKRVNVQTMIGTQQLNSKHIFLSPPEFLTL
jgi:hypothetical protein